MKRTPQRHQTVNCKGTSSRQIQKRKGATVGLQNAGEVGTAEDTHVQIFDNAARETSLQTSTAYDAPIVLGCANAQTYSTLWVLYLLYFLAGRTRVHVVGWSCAVVALLLPSVNCSFSKAISCIDLSRRSCKSSKNRCPASGTSGDTTGAVFTTTEQHERRNKTTIMHTAAPHDTL